MGHSPRCGALMRVLSPPDLREAPAQGSDRATARVKSWVCVPIAPYVCLKECPTSDGANECAPIAEPGYSR